MKTTITQPLVALAMLSAGCTKGNKTIERPNFIIILCDDLGYGDIGCFGATDIKTPNIDRMAVEGMKFTEFYSASPVSSPSRAALLTGRFPQRMGINSVFFPRSLTGMPPSEITIAEMLKTKGYRTAIVGKWHLGHLDRYLPLQQGFDEYFGIPYSNDMESVVYMRGNEVVEFNIDQRYTTRTYTQEAIGFIERNKQQPFFLFLSHTMPHVPLYASEEFMGTSQRGIYGDVVQELDWSVGEILKKLEETKLLDNTLVIFSSDNGPWLSMHELGGSAGILREGKQTTFEGGMRVPTLALWKNVIAPNTVNDKMAGLIDLFPTFAAIVGADLPQDRAIDGKNIYPVFKGEGDRENEEFLYFNGEDLQGYRNALWKVKKQFPGNEATWWKKAVPAHDDLLIDINNDPGEQNNLATQYPDTVRYLFKRMNTLRKKMGDLPPSLHTGTNADISHKLFLQKKYGNPDQK